MAKKTIKLKNYSKVVEEMVAVGVITPGMFLEETSAGLVQAHSGAGANLIQMVATEDEMQGKSISDDYAVGYPVQVWIPGRGDQVFAILEDGETIVIGDFLESAGNGKVQKHVDDLAAADNKTNQIIGVAIEAVDMSDSSGADPSPRIAIRII